MAHFLVLNNLSDIAKSVALQRGLCPPVLAGGKRLKGRQDGSMFGGA